MNTKILKEIIAVIRAEQQRRESLLTDRDPNFAYDQWVFTDEPFVNELCLMLLVTLRHQIERELVGLAARADEDGKEISGKKYQEKVKQLRETNRKGKNIGWKWQEISKRLQLKSNKEYEFIEVLRRLSNSYKHDPSMEPDDELLELLSLETGVKYASLSESNELRKGFAVFTGLKEDADYCDIAEKFVEIASGFLVGVKNQTKLSEVSWGAVSLSPDDFAR